VVQSWQTDLLNLQLSLTVKPMFKYIGSIDQLRALVKLSDNTMGRLAIPRGTRREPVKIRGAKFDAEWLHAVEHEAQRVILYLPGGAYVIRMPNFHSGMVSKLCGHANAKALMAYYRLAPEYPFPACLDDSMLAYEWLLDQGIPADQIAIAGDSAGGGLTLSTLLSIRDRELPLPGCAFMMSPLLDVSDHAPSRWKNALSDSALPAPKNRAINPRPLYLGDNDPANPLV
jgi:acetyl esterase/lipase